MSEDYRSDAYLMVLDLYPRADLTRNTQVSNLFVGQLERGGTQHHHFLPQALHWVPFLKRWASFFAAWHYHWTSSQHCVRHCAKVPAGTPDLILTTALWGVGLGIPATGIRKSTGSLSKVAELVSGMAGVSQSLCSQLLCCDILWSHVEANRTFGVWKLYAVFVDFAFLFNLGG